MSTTRFLKGVLSKSHCFQTIRLQNRLHWNWKQLQDLAKFLSLKIAFGWFLWAVLDHVKHWISSWPLNKVCSTWHELQLLYRSHSHASSLSYCSTWVKAASWKIHFEANQHLEAILDQVMNTNMVPISILSVSKVF